MYGYEADGCGCREPRNLPAKLVCAAGYFQKMIEIRNDGPLIESTNYWATDLAAKGMFYISWNAKTARLLVPPSQAPAIPEMETAEYVIITRGPWADAGGRMAWELLFGVRT